MTVPYLPLVKAFVFFHFVAFKNIFENGLLYEKTAWVFFYWTQLTLAPSLCNCQYMISSIVHLRCYILLKRSATLNYILNYIF